MTPDAPFSRDRFEIADWRGNDIAGGSSLHDGRGERMLASPFDARCELQQCRFVEAVYWDDGDELWFAFRQSAGLIDDKRVDFLHAL